MPKKDRSADSILSETAGPSSPPDPVRAGTPQKIHDISRSHESRSPTRSKRSQREECPRERETPSKSREASRKFDPERKKHVRDKQSEREQEQSRDGSQRFDPETRSHRRSQTSQYQRNDLRDPESAASVRRERDENRSSHHVKIKQSAGRPAKQYRRTQDHKSRPREAQDKPKAGTSKNSQGRRNEDSDVENDSSQEWSSPRIRTHCDSHCRGIDERLKRFRVTDYFNDLCKCSYKSLAAQLWKDEFVKSIIASIAVFGLGVTLCSELDGWTIPDPL